MGVPLTEQCSPLVVVVTSPGRTVDLSRTDRRYAVHGCSGLVFERLELNNVRETVKPRGLNVTRRQFTSWARIFSRKSLLPHQAVSPFASLEKSVRSLPIRLPSIARNLQRGIRLKMRLSDSETGTSNRDINSRIVISVSLYRRDYACR
jgi:hypothetical protein